MEKLVLTEYELRRLLENCVVCAKTDKNKEIEIKKVN